MEGLAVSTMASVGEQQHEGSSNSSTVLSTSVTGEHGDGARVQKKRKGADATAETKKGRQDRSATWSKEETDMLLQACTQISQDKGRFRRTSCSDKSFWGAVSQKVHGRTSQECQRRMDTLTKSWRAINLVLEKKCTQLDEKMLRGMKLATAMTVDWYNQMCEIKNKPDNARVVSIEAGLVQEGDQSNAASPVFAPARLAYEQAAPVPHQHHPSHDIMPLQPLEAPNDSTTVGEDEQVLHQIPCLSAAALVQALIPGAQAAVPPPPPSPKPRHDAYSTQPAVDAAAPELVDLPNDFAAEAVGVPLLGAEADLLEDLIDQLDGWDDEHINKTLDMLQLNRLPRY